MAQVALRLRSTFIDVDEEAALISGAASGGRRPRAASLPPALKQSLEDSDIFEEETAYVASLSGKLRYVWSTSGFDVRSFFTDASKQPEGAGIDEQQSPDNSVHLTEHESNETARAFLLPTEMQEEFTAATGGTTPTPSSSGSIEDDAGYESTQEMLNTGSFGHPEVCSRPCLYFVTGSCAHGSACAFCHLPHLKRPVHLDKKHREMLRNASSKKLVALLVPMLKEKLLSFDSSAESLEAFARFEVASGFASITTSAKLLGQTLRIDRGLQVSFRAMSFRLLLITLLSNALKGDAGAQTEGMALLSQLVRSRANATLACSVPVGGSSHV